VTYYVQADYWVSGYAVGDPLLAASVISGNGIMQSSCRLLWDSEAEPSSVWSNKNEPAGDWVSVIESIQVWR